MTLLRPTRRGFLLGALAAPAIVHAANLMPIFSRLEKSWLELHGNFLIRKVGQGVILPPPIVGQEITIINDGVAPLTIYDGPREGIMAPRTVEIFCDFGRGWEAASTYS